MNSLADRHSDNLRVKSDLMPLPFNDGRLSLFAAVEENIERHDELKIVAHADVHSPPDNSVVWHFRQKARQTRHTQLPETDPRPPVATGRNADVNFGKGEDATCFTLKSKAMGGVAA